MGNQTDPRFTETDAAIIKRKAKRLAGHYGYRISDVEDVEQDLALHVFQQMHRFDPSRGTRGAFVSQITKHKLLNLIEQRTAKKRDDRRNIAHEDAPESALSDHSMTPAQLDLKVEMRDFAARLPSELRVVFDLMLQGYREADMQQHLGLSRQQVRTLVQKLASRMRAKKLEQYIGHQPNRE